MELNTWFGYVGELLPGLVAALKLTGISLGLGLPLALVLALLVDSRLRVVRWVTIGFVEVGRGLPLLVLLYIFTKGCHRSISSLRHSRRPPGHSLGLPRLTPRR